MNAITYLQRKQRLLNTTYIRRNGEGFRIVDGMEITEAQFQADNKLPVRLGISKGNPCNKHKFLDV